MSDAPFIPAALDDAGLDPYAFRIFCRIQRRQSVERGCDESVSNMAAGCGMSHNTVRRALSDLEARGMISAETRSGQTTIYRTTHTRSGSGTPTRSGSTKSGSPTKSGRPPLPDQGDPPLPDQGDKGYPIEGYPIKGIPNKSRAGMPDELPDWFDASVWAEWEQYRTETRKKLTKTTRHRQFIQLNKFAEKGHDPNDSIRASITNGWTGLFEPKPSRVNGSQRQRAHDAKQDPAGANQRHRAAAFAALGLEQGGVGAEAGAKRDR